MLVRLAKNDAPYSAGDRRIKVLWIDDQLPSLASARELQRFDIWFARTPGEVAAGIQEYKEKALGVYGAAGFYNLPSFPFDGYLADFNLSAAGQNVSARMGDDIAPAGLEEQGDDLDFPAQPRPVFSVDQERLACEAEAAGLTTAVLAALHFETHPAVVLPYTAYPEQLARQRALIQLLRPGSLVVGSGAELDLSKAPLSSKLEQLATAYREQLPHWALLGTVDVPYVERRRLFDLLKSRSMEGDDGHRRIRWTEDDYLIVDTLYGRRWLGAQALWFSADESLPLQADVERWLHLLPESRVIYQEARKLALKYWALSNTTQSILRYELSRFIRRRLHSGPDPDLDAAITSRLKQLSINKGLEEILANPKDVRVDTAEKPLYTLHAVDPEAKRLAILMLLTLVYAQRWAFSENVLPEIKEDLEHLFGKLMETGSSTVIDQPDIFSPSDPVENLQQAVHGLQITAVTRDAEGQIRMIERAALEPSDLACCLDPVPAQLLTADEDFRGSRIGMALSRGDLKINFETIMKGQGNDGISPEERRELRIFAWEVGFLSAGWPEFLRKGYAAAAGPPISTPATDSGLTATKTTNKRKQSDSAG